MADTNSDDSDQTPPQWGDSLDHLSVARKRDLRDRLAAWNPDENPDDASATHPGPFVGERLNGLEVFWLAACALAGNDGDPASAAERLGAHPALIDVEVPGLHLSGADLRGALLRQAHLRGAFLIRADLSEADLSEADLSEADLSHADLSHAHLHAALLRGADLREATLSQTSLSEAHLAMVDLREAHLSHANLKHAHLFRADLSHATLSHADLSNADLFMADLSHADLSHAWLYDANLRRADLSHADLTRAILMGVDLSEANLSEANLSEANLSRTHLIDTNLSRATLSGCTVYGVSVWNTTLDGATQSSLRITRDIEPEISVDDLEVAQFLYLMIHNDKIRGVIDTIARKLVLILGRFTPDRKVILDALRAELRRRGYLPVVFDGEKPTSRDLTETIATLAHMARFVIADLTDARSIPQELSAIIPNLPSVAVQPIIQADDKVYPLFEHWRRYPWVLEPHRYEQVEALLATLTEQVIAPAEQRANDIAPLQRR